MNPSRLRRAASLVAALGLAVSLVACGGDDDSSADDAARESSVDAGRPSGSAGTLPPGLTFEPGAGPAETGFAPVIVDGEPLEELPDGADDPAVGQAAPSISGMNYAAEPVSFTSGGRATLLVFLAHWCPHCNEEIPMMLEWSEEGGVPEGLDIVGVSTAANPQYPNFPPGEWLAEKGWDWPVIADDLAYTTGTSFGLAGFPFMVLVDADGNVVGRTSGELPPDRLSEFVAQVASA